MKCPECSFENQAGSNFCNECGNKLEVTCPGCGRVNQPGSKFCNECGHRFKPTREPFDEIIENESLPISHSTEKPSIDKTSIAGERKHVTVLFSDLIGYTAMSEHLDPEDVKEITSLIFGEIAQVIAKYEGFIEKFIGDAVMAVFGIPKAHEDDPVRAIKAAKEIHSLVESFSPKFQNKIEQRLSMHTGINTGLVITGEVNLEKGTHGLTGDAINLASRLEGLSKEGEILVGQETYYQTEGFFNFEPLDPIKVKGKQEPVRVYKLLSERDKPITVHRLTGLKSDLIGRKLEIEELCGGIEKLINGKGSIYSICGTAGTGKSRLVDEFKSKVDLSKVQWLEGYAYPYTMNTPYFPLINLLSKALQIDEEAPPEKVKQKIEIAINRITSDSKDVLPYIGSLYSLPYSEIENVSPEFWKIKLHNAALSVLSALSKQGPTVIFLEDLHWSDPSFLELIRFILSESKDAILFICTYRPHVTLFTAHQISAMFNTFKEYRLQDLSPSESQNMVQSLLGAESAPLELKDFIHDKIQGNPFYLEEVVNSLIETKTLIKDENGWTITQRITERVISSTIHGVIASRLDRLENETKRLLQEASVIGSAFYYQILKKVSLVKENIDRNLSILERLDLIRMKAMEPDLEYIFKHGLTQEVVYNGILKKERQVIHEQIGSVIEQIFKDRLPEFYDALAFHFKHGRTKAKAVQYLIFSGEKSLKKYSVEESHQYFKEAYDMLTTKGDQSLIDRKELILLLNKWALTLYYLGSFRIIEQLFEKHKADAETLDDKSLLGMYYIWLGMALYCREKFQEADRYLSDSLKIGREINDEKVIAYALTWLCWSRVDLGKFNDVTVFAKEARERSNFDFADDYPYYKSTGGEGMACFMAGNSRKNKELGEMLLTLGTQKSQIRSLTLGHLSLGFSHDCAGDFPSAIENYRRATNVAKDPMYEQYSRAFLAMSLLQNGQVNESEEAFEEVIEFCDKQGFEAIGSPAKFYLGFIQILNGQMSKGMKNVETILQRWVKIDRKSILCMAYLSLGKFYAQIASGTESVSLKTMLKNVGFIIKNVPSAMKKAEEYLFQAIEHTGNINATGLKAQSLLELGLLYKIKGNKEKAIKPLREAIEIFNNYGNHVYLEQARSALESL